MARLLRAVALVALMLSIIASASVRADDDDSDDDCEDFDVSFTPSPAVPAYDPFGAEQMREVIVTVKSKSSGTCDVGLAFQRPVLPPVMSRSSSTLAYAIEGVAGNSLVRTSEWGDCMQADCIDFQDMHKNETRSAAVRIRVPAGQVRAAGDYEDDDVDLILVRLNNGYQSSALIKRRRFRPTVRVIAKCVLPEPDPATHNFSAAISQGLPDPAQTRTSTFSNIQCTAPAKVRLVGIAMQPSPAIDPRSGFDSFINWRAAAKFGNAIATLSTNSASQVDSYHKNVASGPTLGGSMSVEINLLKGKPLIAGTYSGTLTVAIDPEF